MAALIDQAVGVTAGSVLHVIVVYDLGGGLRGVRRVSPATLRTALGFTSGGGFVDSTVGDGSATTITITHNLGTRNVGVVVFDNTNYETLTAVRVRRTSINAVQLDFGSQPPALDSLTCIVTPL